MRQSFRATQSDSHPACLALDRWLHGHPELHTLAIYSPLLGEVDLSSLPRQRPDLRWLYPKVHACQLTFHFGSQLLPGAFGILEPIADSPAIAITEIDAFICPGLAFDPRGGRLGRGRGFYDRVLAQARPDALKIGICFAHQSVPDTFAEPHDIPMDIVIF